MQAESGEIARGRHLGLERGQLVASRGTLAISAGRRCMVARSMHAERGAGVTNEGGVE